MAAKYLVFVASALLLLQNTKTQSGTVSEDVEKSVNGLRDVIDTLQGNFNERVASLVDQIQSEFNRESSGWRIVINNGTNAMQDVVQRISNEVNLFDGGEALENMQSNLQTYYDSIRSSLEEIDQQYSAASDNARQQMEETVSNIRNYVEKRCQDLDELRQQMQDSISNQTTQLDHLKNQTLSGITRAFSTVNVAALNGSQLQEFSDNIQNAVNDIKGRFEEGFATAQGQIQAARDQVENNVQGIVQQMNNASAEASRRIQEAQQRASDLSSQAQQNFHDYATQGQTIVNNVQTQIFQFGEKTLQESNNIMIQIQQQVNNARSYFEDVVNAVLNRFETNVQSMRSLWEEQWRDFLEEVNSRLQNGINRAQNAANQASINLQEAIKSGGNVFSSWLGSISSRLNGTRSG